MSASDLPAVLVPAVSSDAQQGARPIRSRRAVRKTVLIPLRYGQAFVGIVAPHEAGSRGALRLIAPAKGGQAKLWQSAAAVAGI